jgi:hypothetical protein
VRRLTAVSTFLGSLLPEAVKLACLPRYDYERMLGSIVWRSRHRKVPRYDWRETEARASFLSHVAWTCGVSKA